MTTIDHAELRRYADVVLSCGVNLEPDQKLLVMGDVGHADLVTALVEAAYERGCPRVETVFADERVMAAQAAGAPSDEAATELPIGYEQLFETVIAERWARVRTVGDVVEAAFADVPAVRASAQAAARLVLVFRTMDAGLNWSLCPCPTPGWAERAYGTADVGRLWADLRFVLRLDESDPIAAWQTRHDELTARAAVLDRAGFTALRFVGGATDLLVPLHPDARWQTAWLASAWGSRFLCNMPSEEVYTAPDWRGVEGVAAVTKPVVVNGVTVEGLVLRFAEGRIVDVEAAAHADAARASIAHDPGAARLGEVALVDGSSRVGAVGRVFQETLLDENAASHIAWGASIDEAFADPLPDDDAEAVARGINRSDVHEDVMIGGSAVSVLGLTATGDEVPVIVEDAWRL
ncbi:MAG TPA: aminopeptidase [Thermoleophilia bacterium]|nr:aminopeptidase [Thermoleophilia bacterium]